MNIKFKPCLFYEINNKQKKPVDYDTNILPACLPSLEDTFEGERCSLTGWGLTYSSKIK